MERYSEYKDSGIYFIPDIPKTWQVLKAKYLFNQEKREVRPEDEIVTCFRDGQVTLRKNRRTEGFTNSMKEIGYQGVRKGDLVIHNMDAFAGAIGVSDSDGKGTPVYACCTPKREDVNQYYYCYLLRYLARNGFILSLAKGIRERSTDFRFNDFKELYLPVPSRAEQDSIVAYIDIHSAKIDEAIAQQQKMIDLLNERKQIIINNAVTKGLNPDVPMKDSGVDWIGEIPEHWEVKRVKSCVSELVTGVWGNDPKEDNTDVICYRIADFNYSRRVVCKDKLTYRSYGKELTSSKLLKKGDLLLEKSGGGDKFPVGRVVIYPFSDETATCSNFIQILRIAEGISPEYLCFYMNASYSMGTSWFCLNQTTGIQNLQIGTFLGLPCCIPPFPEQRDIVKYLNSVTHDIEMSIDACEHQISLLQERKQIIINDVVTGKVKVC